LVDDSRIIPPKYKNMPAMFGPPKPKAEK